MEIHTPLKDEVVSTLELGDQVYFSGKIYIMRDATLRRIFEEGVSPPVDLRNQVIFFGAPSFAKEMDRYVILSVGVTTSQRMEKYIPSLLSKYGVKGIIGKGELGEKMNSHFQRNNAAYFLFVGGAAAIATSSIERVLNVWWEDLRGEALFEVEVKDLGPAFVAIDNDGENLPLNVKNKVLANLRALQGDQSES
ncbi:Fe-S hydro-lyase subunit beta [Metallosphaera tengchongensis]|uniref:Fe-S hydro-lyase subunit beta n=1 Tax=Metallosphaera tengchongensis TaxID=1532350 RepID=A0A6N0NU11_9CREN|nr:FumA C-terminus/TtdB family hydratase beta subunit [Metallosphaera tengchongensis]QKR00192.1 Fe-S hydro-lyase subunit beta [Metallosphaera tengchongensis]